MFKKTIYLRDILEVLKFVSMKQESLVVEVLLEGEGVVISGRSRGGGRVELPERGQEMGELLNYLYLLTGLN